MSEGGVHEIADASLERLLTVVFRHYHYDFRAYAAASLRRRVAAAIARFGDANVAALEARIVTDASAFTELLRFLTVQVSDLFRDPGYFRAIRTIVVPYLETYPSLKIWIAGCATGEEAYSLAILLDEHGLLARTQLYATDIHPASLRTAADGAYELGRFARFSENYLAAGGRASLSDYYTAGYGQAIFDRRLRQAILFSDHSLSTDSAFAEVQLVSCRNVLIYFDRELQDRAVGVLYDSLCRRGFLGLGSKESLRFTRHAGFFREIAPEERLFQKL
ncbi:MAG TPA: CheR family methyltransferase [Polyangia bacterium]|nr:CheR family methyltransferase [Polyangia bacterium]